MNYHQRDISQKAYRLFKTAVFYIFFKYLKQFIKAKNCTFGKNFFSLCKWRPSQVF